MKGIDYIKQLDSKELTDFILNKAPLIGRQYTSSFDGLHNWLDSEVNEREARCIFDKEMIDLDSLINILTNFKDHIVFDKNINDICYSATLVKALVKTRNVLKEIKDEH